MPTEAISLKNVSLIRGHNTIIKAANWQLAFGESGLVIGPSGSGKSSLFALISGELTPEAGEVLVSGLNMGAAGAAQRARFRQKTLAVIYQDYNLIPDYSVMDNIVLADFLSAQKPDIARAEALLNEVGLLDKAGAKALSLSGGEKQRVAIARALYGQKRIILADEPTGSLDDASAELVIKALRACLAPDRTLLIATHDSRLEAVFPVLAKLPWNK